MLDERSQNKALVQRFFEEVWNQGRTESIFEIVADDAIAHGLAHEDAAALRGPAAFMPFYQSFRNAFPDIKVTAEDLIEENDKVVARCRVTGTHAGEGLGVAATHQPINITGVAITRIQDGKLAETWNTFDLLGLFQQIGAMGPPANNDTTEETNASFDSARLEANPPVAAGPAPFITTEVDNLRGGI